MEYQLHVDETDGKAIEGPTCQMDTKLRGESQLEKKIILPEVNREKVIEEKNPTLIFKRAGDKVTRMLRRKEAEKDLEKIKEEYFFEFFNGNYIR